MSWDAIWRRSRRPEIRHSSHVRRSDRRRAWLDAGRAFQPFEPFAQLPLPFRGRLRVEDWIPDAHHRGAGDERLSQGERVDFTASMAVGVQDGIRRFVVGVQQAGIPDDRREVPLHPLP